MPQDLSIVHLTDLHFHVSQPRAPWSEPILKAFKRLSAIRSIEIAGLAVTGDLVDSPDLPALTEVKCFLGQAAEILGLKSADGMVDWDRVWIVDGNHDYRWSGLWKKTPTNGVQEGNQLKRLVQYRDQKERFAIFGLDSSRQGAAARGGVELADLREIQRAAGSNMSYRYRIALIHHHLLPLPDRPAELDDGRFRRIKRMANDEAFKLLSNAGLTTDFLLEGAFHLVLHGHEHKAFAASVKYHDRHWRGHIMAVVGGPAAKDGFQLITFKESGDAEMTRYIFENADFRAGARFALWLADDWKRADWERQRTSAGGYQRAEISSRLSETGEFRQTSNISGIVGGESDRIEKIVIRGATDDPTGRVALVSFHDKATSADVPVSNLPPSGQRFEYIHPLNPPASFDQLHPGLKYARASGNNFAMTQDEMRLRKPKGPFKESITLFNAYATERVIFTHRFPSSYAPLKVEVRAIYRNSDPRREDVAETRRAERKLLYFPEEGFVSFDLNWTTPNHQYEISWDLPSERDVYAEHDRANIARYYLTKLAGLPSGDRAASLVLAKVRERCFELIRHEAEISVEMANAVYAPEEDLLGLWAFDEERGQTRAVAGTYDPSSKWWGAELGWGAGVRGRAMKRGTVEFYRKTRVVPAQDIYHQPPGCDQEKYLLCVPIPLPPEAADHLLDILGDATPVKFCRLVASLASLREKSLLHHLADKVELRHEVADLVLFETSDLIKKLVPIQ